MLSMVRTLRPRLRERLGGKAMALRIALVNYAEPFADDVKGGTCWWYKSDAEFGVTAHTMIEKVDAGPIIRVLTFPVRDGRQRVIVSTRTRLLSAPVLRDPP